MSGSTNLLKRSGNMQEANNGIIAELDRYFLRKNPSDFLGTKDETGEVISYQSQKDCGSLRPGLIAVRNYMPS